MKFGNLIKCIARNIFIQKSWRKGREMGGRQTTFRPLIKPQ